MNLRFIGLAAALALAGCAAPPAPRILARTPAMVTICAPSKTLDESTRMAQQSCQVSGRNAELIPPLDQLCEAATLKFTETWVRNYRCVP